MANEFTPSPDLELNRKLAARQGYIAWRMNDLPAVYQNLMPYTYMAKELYAAEKQIRMQHKADIEFDKQPWRKLGPPCRLIDLGGMSGEEKMAFGIDGAPFAGLDDLPKWGRADEVRPIIDAARDKWLAEHPEHDVSPENNRSLRIGGAEGDAGGEH